MARRRLPKPVRLTDDRGSDKYPRMIVDRRGRQWFVWQRFAGDRDSVVVTCLRDNCVVLQQEFSNFGCAYKPVLCEDAAGRIVVAWSEVAQGGANVFLTSIHHGRRAMAVQVSLGSKDLEPALAADDKGGVWVAYHSFRTGKARVFLRRFLGGWSDEIEVAPGMEAYRPALVALADGKVRVYFDAFAGGRYDVYGVECDENMGVSEPVRLSSGGTWCTTPVAVPDGNGGAVVAWNGIGADSYVCYDVSAAGRTERVASTGGRCASHDVWADGDSVWLAWCDGRLAILARRLDRAVQEWSAPVVVSGREPFNRRPTMAVDGSGAVWFAWQASPGRGKDAARKSDIYIQRLYPAEAAVLGDASIACHAWPSETGHEIVASPELARFTTSSGGQVFWGDIHGHACFSDGLGTHDELYNFARSVSRLDFAAVTEHCEFPDELSGSEWNVTGLVVSAFNEPGAFVTLLGYEWTSSEVRGDYGHKNVYYPGDAGEVFSPCRERGATPEALCAGAKQYGALVVPHHVSVSWGATDWSHHDPQAERVCEIASVHGVMEYDGNPRAHVDPPVPNRSVQSALALGCRLGLVASGDAHRLAPGRSGGIAAVVCDKLTREAVFGALRSRHCYASTGPRLLIEFSVDGHGMGEKAPPKALSQAGVVKYAVAADRALVAVEIVRDNEVVHQEGPSGQKISGEWQDLSPGSYYYLRIELEGGEFAWSSPIWTG